MPGLLVVLVKDLAALLTILLVGLPAVRLAARLRACLIQLAVPLGARLLQLAPPLVRALDYDAATDTETFRILDNRSNRSEIRLQNEYSIGRRQFQGYVTFSAPLDDESLMQIFGSTTGATQLMIRGYAANGGEMRGAGATLASGIDRATRPPDAGSPVAWFTRDEYERWLAEIT